MQWILVGVGAFVLAAVFLAPATVGWTAAIIVACLVGAAVSGALFASSMKG